MPRPRITTHRAVGHFQVLTGGREAEGIGCSLRGSLQAASGVDGP